MAKPTKTPATITVKTRDGLDITVPQDRAPDYPYYRVYRNKLQQWLVLIGTQAMPFARAYWGITDPDIQVRRRDPYSTDFTPANCFLFHKKRNKELPWAPGEPRYPDNYVPTALPTPDATVDARPAAPPVVLHTYVEAAKTGTQTVPQFIDVTGTGFVVNTTKALALIDVRDPEIVSVDLLLPERTEAGVHTARTMGFAFEGAEGQRAREWAMILADSTGEQTLRYVEQVRLIADQALAENERLKNQLIVHETAGPPEDPRYVKLIAALKNIGFDPERLLQ